MPDQGMPAHRHLMFTGEGSQLIGRSETVYMLLGMEAFELHLIFGSDTVEMVCQQMLLRANGMRVHRCANLEICGK
ncbi:hypothetical protein D3C85_1666830 [compost metagenome]